MDRSELLAAWQREETAPFSGWDFAYLAGRMVEDDPPWEYLARAAVLMQTAASVVDLDTGGGERFLELRPYWPAKVVVTEEVVRHNVNPTIVRRDVPRVAKRPRRQSA